MDEYSEGIRTANIIIMCERMGISWEQAEKLMQRRERKEKKLARIY